MIAHHRVAAPTITHRVASADDEKPLCSFYSKTDNDDRYATYNSITGRLTKLAKTTNEVVLASASTMSQDNDDIQVLQLLNRIVTDASVCLTVSNRDKRDILKHVCRQTTTTATTTTSTSIIPTATTTSPTTTSPTTPIESAPTTTTTMTENQPEQHPSSTTTVPTPSLSLSISTSHLLFTSIRMLIALECIRQEGWIKNVQFDILENDDRLLLSADDAKEKSILKVFHQEKLLGEYPPKITLESFSREIRVAERRLRMFSHEVLRDMEFHKDSTTISKEQKGGVDSTNKPLQQAKYTVASFVDRSKVNLMQALPIACMNNNKPITSLDRPIQSPRAAEYLNSAMKAMPNNVAIQSSLRLALKK